jgi:hypothetical protein
VAKRRTVEAPDIAGAAVVNKSAKPQSETKASIYVLDNVVPNSVLFWYANERQVSRMTLNNNKQSNIRNCIDAAYRGKRRRGLAERAANTDKQVWRN